LCFQNITVTPDRMIFQSIFNDNRDIPTPEQKELMPDDSFADDYWWTYQITNAMYAALIVSLWACVEGYLKGLLSVCRGVRNLKKKVPYKFDAIKDSFLKEMDINLEQLPRYSTINAIRILNNSFKHSEGYYLPETGKSHTQIAHHLLTKWKCISNRFVELKAIDYDKLPIQELVFTCGTFFEGLSEQIKKNLKGLGDVS